MNGKDLYLRFCDRVHEQKPEVTGRPVNPMLPWDHLYPWARDAWDALAAEVDKSD